MKKLMIVCILFLMAFSLFSDMIPVEQYTGYQWERLNPMRKTDIVSGYLAGFSVWRDYAFDLDTELYNRYQSFDNFMNRNNIVEKIIEDLDKYYIINSENYKYNDRVTTMIIVFYGKYWWIEIPVE